MQVYGVHIRMLYLGVLTSSVFGCLGNDIFLLCHLILAGSHLSIFFLSSNCHLEFLGDCRFTKYLCTSALFHNQLW